MDTEPAPEQKLSCSEVVGLAVLLGVIAMVVLLLFVGPALKHHFVDARGPAHQDSSSGQGQAGAIPLVTRNASARGSLRPHPPPRG